MHILTAPFLYCERLRDFFLVSKSLSGYGICAALFRHTR
jgi:hypothetical protein